MFTPCKKCLVAPVCKESLDCDYITEAYVKVNRLFKLGIFLQIIFPVIFCITAAIDIDNIQEKTLLFWFTESSLIIGTAIVIYSIIKKEALDDIK